MYLQKRKRNADVNILISVVVKPSGNVRLGVSLRRTLLTRVTEVTGVPATTKEEVVEDILTKGDVEIQETKVVGTVASQGIFPETVVSPSSLELIKL
jgi:hypothetical protein